MEDSWRPFLYYPLGLLPSIFFSLRFFIQWIQSERKKESYVQPIFWKLSFAGSFIFCIHYTIQVQYPFAMIQAANTFIAWRNLNLMGTPYPFKKIIPYFVLLLGTITLFFLFQGVFLLGEIDWVRAPIKLGDIGEQEYSKFWHLFGFLGGSLFASRFWVQWWQAERHMKSHLGRSFWWLSVFGSLISLTYFMHIRDIVSAMNYTFGLVPYLRNLVLLRRKRINV